MDFTHNIKKPVFSDSFYENNFDDCQIMAECGAMNLPLLTLNSKHFIGVFKDDIRQQIKERFEMCDDFTRRKFNTSCKRVIPITVPEFLAQNFPNEYKKVQEGKNSHIAKLKLESANNSAVILNGIEQKYSTQCKI